jgi:hypothetical protein
VVFCCALALVFVLGGVVGLIVVIYQAQVR